MTFLKLYSDGIRTARRHPLLVLAAYLLPLLPALLLAMMARSTLSPALDYSLFSERILDGSWFGVWRDFAASPACDLAVVTTSGLTLAILLTALLQIAFSAGAVEVLLAGETADRLTFFSGIVQHTWKFVRSAVWFGIAASLAIGAAGAVVAASGKLAEKKLDGSFDLYGAAAAALVAFLLMALFDPAYDLSRIAAARHGDRKTLRGFLRAVWTVLRHPSIFLPLYLAVVLSIVAVHAIYTLARTPFTPASALAILALLAAQQLVMLVRAYLQVSFWGAAVSAYHHLGEPRLCEKRRRRLLVVDEPAAGEPEPTPAVAGDVLPEPAAVPAPSPAAADDVFAPTTER